MNTGIPQTFSQTYSDGGFSESAQDAIHDISIESENS